MVTPRTPGWKDVEGAVDEAFVRADGVDLGDSGAGLEVVVSGESSDAGGGGLVCWDGRGESREGEREGGCKFHGVVKEAPFDL